VIPQLSIATNPSRSSIDLFDSAHITKSANIEVRKLAWRREEGGDMNTQDEAESKKRA